MMTGFARWLFYPLIAMVLGFLIDMFIGDPEWSFHPVKLVGKLIEALEKLFRKMLPTKPAGERIAGALALLVLAVICCGVPFGLLWLCYRLTPVLGVIVEAAMCWFVLATRSLRLSGMRVYRALRRGSVTNAKRAVSRVVSRDTEELDETGVIRAAVEGVSENICDASVAPIIYMALGGAPLAFLYRAVNTMDAMVGRIDKPYKDFGLIPAKVDDVFNFIPARIAALLTLIGGFIHNFNVTNGRKIFKRDRYNHPSPNAGQTESVCAGLLGIQLGGSASYGGVIHKKEKIGDALRPIEPKDIARTCRLLYDAAILSAILFFGIRLIVFIANLPH